MITVETIRDMVFSERRAYMINPKVGDQIVIVHIPRPTETTKHIKPLNHFYGTLWEISKIDTSNINSYNLKCMAPQVDDKWDVDFETLEELLSAATNEKGSEGTVCIAPMSMFDEETQFMITLTGGYELTPELEELNDDIQSYFYARKNGICVPDKPVEEAVSVEFTSKGYKWSAR